MIAYLVSTCLLALSSLAYGTADLAIPRGVLIGSGLDVSFVAEFAFFVAVVLLWTVAWGKILHKVCWLPTIAGQIVGGIILGPSFLNVTSWPCFAKSVTFVDAASGTLYALASSDLFVFVILLISAALTVSYLLWIAGHETDIQDILKVGVTATSAGILGAILPIIMTVGAAYLFLPGYFTLVACVGIGIIFSATSVSIPVAMLFSRNKMHLKSSKATLGAAIIDDIFAVILLSMFFMAVQAGVFGSCETLSGHMCNVSLTQASLYMIISCAVIFLTGYCIVPRIINYLKTPSRSYLIAPVASGIMLLYFAFADLVGGLAGITGAYFAGLFHRMGDHDHHAQKAISPYVNAFLLPLFLGSIGLQINIAVLSLYEWFVVLLLLVVSIISKLIGCYMATALSNVSGRRGNQTWTNLESYIFGSSMVARGEVGLVIATILNGSSLIDARQYVVAVVVIVLTTIASPIMLSIGFARQEELGEDEQEKDYVAYIGHFAHIGTEQMLDIIIGQLEELHMFKTTISFSEGRRIVNLEGQHVKIVFDPERGIIFEGSKSKIKEIVQSLQQSLNEDISKLSRIH